MPRQARFTVENGTYHVMMRGNNRNEIFHDEDDFQRYLDVIKENKEKFKLKIYHYALMDNHIHLMIQSPNGKALGDAIKRMNVSYTRYYRKKYKGIGHFFQDRFKSCLIQDGIYLLECGRYIELNPVRAEMVKEPGEYKWSSYKVYGEGKQSDLVDIDPEYEGLHEQIEKRIETYRQYIKDGKREKRNEERFFKQGVYGSKEYIAELKQKGLKPVWSHGGRPKKQQEAKS